MLVYSREFFKELYQRLLERYGVHVADAYASVIEELVAEVEEQEKYLM